MNIKNNPPKKSVVREWVETIIIALVLALLIRGFVVQVFYIPSGSMEPTLEVRDRIVVNKFVYRFKDPERMEIIVFKDPKGAGRQQKDIIKRVIGLPNETLFVKNGVVHINKQPLVETHSMNRDFSNFGPVSVPKDHYFVMGDNRPNSSDSRFWGFVPRKNIAGPAFVRIWPLTRIGLLP